MTDNGQRAYQVVINNEEQYSIWFDDRPRPPGWHGVDVTGTKEECLAYIEKAWTDMRPLSLRRQMAGSPDPTGGPRSSA